MCQVCPLVGTANDVCFLECLGQKAGESPGFLSKVTLSSFGSNAWDITMQWEVGGATHSPNAQLG